MTVARTKRPRDVGDRAIANAFAAMLWIAFALFVWGFTPVPDSVFVLIVVVMLLLYVVYGEEKQL